MFRKINTEKVNETFDLAAKVLKILYILLIAVAMYVVLVIFRELKIFGIIKTIIKVVSPLFIGFVVAWLFDPFVNFLERKKIKRIWGSIIVYVIMILVIVLVMSSLIPLLISQVKEFVKMIPSVLDFIDDIFDKTLKGFISKKEFYGSIEGFTKNVPNNLMSTINNLAESYGEYGD